MAYAARFRALLFGAITLWGASVWADEVPAQVPPVAPAPSSVPAGTPKGSEPGGTVSLLGYVLTIVVLGAAGVTVLLKGGFFGVAWGAAKTARKLHIEESRTVGSRQHLAVVEYEGRRVLLGISPGRIDFLCGLDGDASGNGPVFSEALSAATAVSLSGQKADHRVEGTKEGL
jgi:flagellar biogenesis protein FliO